MHKLNYSARKMADLFGCSTQTVYKNLYSLGLKQRDRFTDIDNAELDEKVQALQTKYPNSGSVVRLIFYILKVVLFSSGIGMFIIQFTYVYLYL